MVDSTELAFAAKLFGLSENEFFVMTSRTKEKRATGRMTKWQIILLNGPDGGWKTQGLSPDTLRQAFNASLYNSALFVDHNGNPVADFGLLLGFATEKYSGYKLTERLLKKLITSEVR